MMRSRRISAVFQHDDGYRWEEVYESKKQLARAIRSLKHAVWLHATDYTDGMAVYPSNLWGYLRT